MSQHHILVRMTQTDHKETLCTPLQLFHHKVGLKSVTGHTPFNLQKDREPYFILCSNVVEATYFNGTLIPWLEAIPVTGKRKIDNITWKNSSGQYFDKIHLYITDGNGEPVPEGYCDLICTLEFVPAFTSALYKTQG